MKKKYFVPETEISRVKIELNFLASGENLNNKTYGSDPGEDTDGFWD